MSHLDRNATSIHLFLVIKRRGEKQVVGREVFLLIVDFLCLRSGSLGSTGKQIIIWDINVFFSSFIGYILFSTCFLALTKIFQYCHVRGACWVMAVRVPRACVQEGSGQRASSNPAAVSQDESFMKADFSIQLAGCQLFLQR